MKTVTHVIFLRDSDALSTGELGQTGPTAYFYTSYKVKRVFTFSKGRFIKRERLCYRDRVWSAKAEPFTMFCRESMPTLPHASLCRVRAP